MLAVLAVWLAWVLCPPSFTHMLWQGTTALQHMSGRVLPTVWGEMHACAKPFYLRNSFASFSIFAMRDMHQCTCMLQHAAASGSLGKAVVLAGWHTASMQRHANSATFHSSQQHDGIMPGHHVMQLAAMQTTNDNSNDICSSKHTKLHVEPTLICTSTLTLFPTNQGAALSKQEMRHMWAFAQGFSTTLTVPCHHPDTNTPTNRFSQG